MPKPYWYNIEELPEYPALNLEICFAAIQDMRALGFPNIGASFVPYMNGTGPLFVSASGWDRASRGTVRRIVRHPRLYDDHHRWYLRECRRLRRVSEKTFRATIQSCSTRELERMFSALQRSITVVHLGRVPGWVMEQRFELFTRYVIGELQKHIKRRKASIDAAYAFSVLSSPMEKTHSFFEEADMLRLAARAGAIPERLLTRHVEAYRDYTYGLVGPGMTKAELLRRIRQARHTGNPRRALQYHLQKLQRLKKQQRQLVTELKLPQRIAALARIAQLIGFEKAWGKEIQFMGHAAMERIGTDIGRRFSMTLRQFRWMLPQEVVALLATGKRPGNRELDARWKRSGLLITRQGMSFLRGGALKRFQRANRFDTAAKVDRSLRQLHGMPAVVGSTRGIVRIIESPAEMKKMNAGNILVSHMTIPEIVPAMRKAAAVVTDIGGLTCHAAIVCRELDIPCVIGTKVATKVFKDGDRVEVDATEGIIRKI